MDKQIDITAFEKNLQMLVNLNKKFQGQKLINEVRKSILIHA